MAWIDVGADATNRNDAWSNGYTTFGLDNPANASGVITSIEIWASETLEYGTVKVITASRSGANFTPRDVVAISGVTAGSKLTITVDASSNPIALEIEAGDYIGIYYSAGKVEASDAGGGGVYYKHADQSEAGEQTYTLSAGVAISLYGSGYNQEDAVCSISVGASVSAIPTGPEYGEVSINSVASVVADGVGIFQAETSLESSASMTVAGIRQAVAQAAISAAASMSAEADTQHWILLACDIAASASMTATSNQVWGGAVVVSAVPSVAAQAASILKGALSVGISSSVYAQCIGTQFCTVAIEAVPSVSALAHADYNSGACVITVVPSLVATALAYVTKTLGFSGTIGAGEVLVIDTDNRTVTLDGVNVRESFTGEFWALYDGTNEIAWHSNASPTAELKIEHDPRWL